MKGLHESGTKLQSDAEPVGRWTSRLNPKLRDKVEEEIDAMLGGGLLSPVIESEWVTPILISIKRNGGRNKGIDLRMLHDVCEIPFPHHLRKKYGGAGSRSVPFYRWFIRIPSGRDRGGRRQTWDYFNSGLGGCFAHNAMCNAGMKNAPVVGLWFLQKKIGFMIP